MNKIQATLIANEISTADATAHSFLQKSKLGEKTQNKITYSPYEAFFLQEKNNIEIKNFQNKILTTKELLKKFSKLDKNFQSKYIVFKDLREKGYIPKTGLKFGADFRVYEKNQTHSKWLCWISTQNSKTTWQEFAAKNRVAHSTKKKILLAIVDHENEITYYETSWVQP